MVVHYKHKMLSIFDVNLEQYQVIDIFRDVKRAAMEHSVKFPKFVGFLWHPSRKENQRWALRCGKDWVRLASHWENMKKVM